MNVNVELLALEKVSQLNKETAAAIAAILMRVEIAKELVAKNIVKDEWEVKSYIRAGQMFFRPKTKEDWRSLHNFFGKLVHEMNGEGDASKNTIRVYLKPEDKKYDGINIVYSRTLTEKDACQYVEQEASAQTPRKTLVCQRK